MKDRRGLFFAVLVTGLVLDQAIKLWVRRTLVEGQIWSGGPIPGIFEITLSYNKGIAFGLFQGIALLMAPVAIVIGGYAIRHILRNPNETRWVTWSLALLAAGAFGNLIDRVAISKGVTDMFLVRLANITERCPVHLRDFPVFNVADSCISIAMVMLIIGWGRAEKAASVPSPGSHDDQMDVPSGAEREVL